MLSDAITRTAGVLEQALLERKPINAETHRSIVDVLYEWRGEVRALEEKADRLDAVLDARPRLLIDNGGRSS